MKKILYIFSLLCILAPQITRAQEYSLAELYSLALERSEKIRISEDDLYIAEREKDRATSVLFPKLSVFGSHIWYSEQKRNDTFTLQPEYSSSWGLKLTQSLYLNGREFIALRMAKESIIKTKFNLDSIKEEYLLNVASLYYDVLKAKKASEIARASVERLTKHRDAAKVRLQVGEITKTGLLRAEAELSAAQSDLIKADNGLRLAKTVLARTVGIEGDYEVKEGMGLGVMSQELKDIVPANCQLPAVDCLRQIALSERAELKAIEHEKRIMEDEVKYTKGLYWPTVSVEGAYSKREDYPSLSFRVKESTYGILRFDFPFFEGGLRKAEVRQAEAKLRQMEYKVADLKDSINVEVENAYLEVITQSGVLDMLKARVEYATDNYKVVSKQFEHGLANSIDVMDANTLLVTAERELANAQYDYQLAVLKVRRAAGTLLKTVSK